MLFSPSEFSNKKYKLFVENIHLILKNKQKILLSTEYISSYMKISTFKDYALFMMTTSQRGN